MGRYFKVIDKNRTDGRIDYVDGDEEGMYDIIESIVGDEECPCNGIPYCIEVDGWCDLACEGEVYETKDLVVECLTEEEYEEYTD